MGFPPFPGQRRRLRCQHHPVPPLQARCFRAPADHGRHRDAGRQVGWPRHDCHEDCANAGGDLAPTRDDANKGQYRHSRIIPTCLALWGQSHASVPLCMWLGAHLARCLDVLVWVSRGRWARGRPTSCGFACLFECCRGFVCLRSACGLVWLDGRGVRSDHGAHAVRDSLCRMPWRARLARGFRSGSHNLPNDVLYMPKCCGSCCIVLVRPTSTMISCACPRRGRSRGAPPTQWTVRHDGARRVGVIRVRGQLRRTSILRVGRPDDHLRSPEAMGPGVVRARWEQARAAAHAFALNGPQLLW